MIVAILTGVRRNLTVVLTCILLIAKDADHFMRYSLDDFISSSEKSLYRPTVSLSSLYQGYQFTFRCVACGDSLWFCLLHFYLTNSLVVQKVLRSHLPTISLNLGANKTLFINSFSTYISCGVLHLYFFNRSFRFHTEVFDPSRVSFYAEW